MADVAKADHITSTSWPAGDRKDGPSIVLIPSVHTLGQKVIIGTHLTAREEEYVSLGDSVLKGKRNLFGDYQQFLQELSLGQKTTMKLLGSAQCKSPGTFMWAVSTALSEVGSSGSSTVVLL